MPTQFLEEGLDPTALECITRADLLQMIRNASPVDPLGWIIWSETAPDVVAEPKYERFLWGKLDGSGDPIGEFYYWLNGAWTLLPIVDGSLLADGSVPLDKLSLTGADPYEIIQVNAAGDALVFVSIPNAIQNNTISPVKLIAPDEINNYVLTCLAGVKAFTTIANFLAAIDDGSIPVDKLEPGDADPLKYWLSTSADGTTVLWSLLDINYLYAAGMSAGQSIRRNAGNTAWEYYTPPTAVDQYALYEGRTSVGVDGGTFTNGAWRTRALTVEVVDANAIGTLAANQVTLAAGRYRFRARATSYRVGPTRLQLYNATAAAAITTSADMSMFDEIGDDNANIVSEASGEFTLAVTSAVEVQHICTTTNADDGFGRACNLGSLEECYVRLELWKVA